MVQNSLVEKGDLGKSSYLHVPLSHHDLSCVGILHQLLQRLGVDVMQCHMGLAALTHLIWGTGHRK